MLRSMALRSAELVEKKGTYIMKTIGHNLTPVKMDIIKKIMCW